MTAGSQTQYYMLDKDYTEVHNRQVTSLDCRSLATSYVFNEIDVVGIVTQITTSTVYLTDAKFNLFGIQFWPGVQVSFICLHILLDNFHIVNNVCLHLK